uniref:Metalloproteinase inhibitor 3-like n=1 Tax=Crassostrea virginica TaxID=6565 RepID=A0A8B8B2C2_CRAVI|nr:metalloproteinase inhibitor 3-like [Crassostrea virginica]
MRAAVLILLVVLVSVYTYTEACSCLRQHPQTKFCRSNFVIKANILKRRSTGPTQFDDVVYTVQIVQDYKNQRNFYTRQIQDIFTASNSAACGSYFEIGSEYLILGSIHSGKWRTGLCNGNALFSSLNSQERDAYTFGYYKKGCSCEIEECVDIGENCPPPASNTCVIKQNDDFQCFYRENTCRRGPWGGCAWHSPACH